MPESRRERRQDEIFRLLREGKSAAEIDDFFVARKQHHDEIKATIGIPAERKVLGLLTSLSYVLEATLTHEQRQERELRDIKIQLDPTRFHEHFAQALTLPNATLWAQVKSGRRGLQRYKEHVMSKFDVEPQDVDLWMRENRQVLLNGANPGGDILNSFGIQLHAMNSYWLGKHR